MHQNAAGLAKLSLLDFGWCLWHGFALSPAEVELLDERLRSDFDARHFRTSLRETLPVEGRSIRLGSCIYVCTHRTLRALSDGKK